MLDKIYLAGILALVILSLGLFVTVQYQKNKILEVTIERDNAKAAVIVKQLELDNSKVTQETLETLLTQEKENASNLEDALEVIKNESESDNGPVSPLLRRSIDGLRLNN